MYPHAKDMWWFYLCTFGEDYWCVSFWMKKENIVPIHKKCDKRNIKNYQPVSLLSICSKIFERVIFKEMFINFSANKVISKNQSGFQPGDSCINQLLSITHEILRSFDYAWEVRSVSLDISKAFDKIWHEKLIFNWNETAFLVNFFTSYPIF